MRQLKMGLGAGAAAVGYEQEDSGGGGCGCGVEPGIGGAGCYRCCVLVAEVLDQ